MTVALDRRRIARDLAEIVAFGPRFAGGTGERLCCEHLLGAFTRAGLRDVARDDFVYPHYDPGHASCTLIDDAAELPVTPIVGTALASAQGDAVFIGAGTPAEIEAAEGRAGGLAGKVAIAWPTSVSRCAAALEPRNIAALVNMSPTPGGMVASFAVARYPPPLAPPWTATSYPGVTVELAAALRLLALLSTGVVRLRVTHTASYHEGCAANVVGRVPGDARPGEIVLVGAHYDTQLATPGAWDNGTGIASLLEIARAVSAARPARSVEFVGFTVEEQGLHGSAHHAAAASARGGLPVAMVNLDTIGAPLNGRRRLVASPVIAPIALSAVRATGWDPDEHIDPDTVVDFDYRAYAAAGVPVAALLQDQPPHPYYHAAGDTLELVDIERTAAAAEATAAVVLALAAG